MNNTDDKFCPYIVDLSKCKIDNKTCHHKATHRCCVILGKWRTFKRQFNSESKSHFIERQFHLNGGPAVW